MENHLKSLDELSFKDTILRRIAVMLCSNARLARIVVGTYLMPYPKERQDMMVQSKVSQIVSKLSLPKPMAAEWLNIMKPACREMAKWVNYHESFLGKHPPWLRFLPLEKYLCWTPMATVDYRKTAQELIRLEVLGRERLYKIACLYCLDDCIRDLYKKIPRRSRKRRYDPKNCRVTLLPEIVVFWTCIVKRKGSEMLRQIEISSGVRYSSVYQYGFVVAAENGHNDAVRYFFEMLNAAERESVLMSGALGVSDMRFFDAYDDVCEYQIFSDMLFYLLSQMNEQQRMGVLRCRAFEILKCCLDWPRQGIFIDVAEIAFPYIDEEQFSRLMYILCHNISTGCNYSEILRKFFLASPKKLKDYARIRYGYFLRGLVQREEIGMIKFIFENTDAADRMGLALNSSVVFACIDAAKNDRWDFLELFLQDLPSNEDKMKFKKAFMAHYNLGRQTFLRQDSNRRKFEKIFADVNEDSPNPGCSIRSSSSKVNFSAIENFEASSREELKRCPPTEAIPEEERAKHPYKKQKRLN